VDVTVIEDFPGRAHWRLTFFSDGGLGSLRGNSGDLQEAPEPLVWRPCPPLPLLAMVRALHLRSTWLR
jgi:hypothetical protein